MADHDGRYKRFFSHPRMVRDLLLGFLREEWLSWADLKTLRRVSSSFTHGDLRQKHGDMLWRLDARPGKDWVDFYVLLEFQSAADRFLPVRLMSYVSGLLEDLIKRRELAPGRNLPLVLPVVLYRGRRPWKVPLDLRDLFAAVPASFGGSLPCLPYRLIDLERLPPGDLDQPTNLAAAFFRIETRRAPEDLRAVAVVLQRQLAIEKDSWLRRSFVDLLTQGYQSAYPEATISDIQDLEDVIMLEENMRRWHRNTLQRGVRKGRIEGMQAILLRLIEDRFGSVPAEIESKVKRVNSQAELERLTLEVAKAADLEQLVRP